MANTLYYFPPCPFSRKVRVFMREKGLDFSLVEENPWRRRKEFVEINPVCQVPVLVNDKSVIVDSQAICEYIEEVCGGEPRMGRSPYERAKVRRLVYWIDCRFYHEVTRYVINEKIAKQYTKHGSPPNPSLIRASMSNLQSHVRYMEHLIDTNGWLASREFTLADVALAAHISLLDYMGIFPWDLSPTLKEWYSLIKSKPSFSQILGDRIPGFAPPVHYAQLDF
ncbi:MAG: glutathione S-transferase family protein [Anaplasma ovis]|uniref:Glutathione S-transferase n=1 Tax=Anaplasma ovis str. Haibei TaxID=1248439 RepID=A0A2Z2LBD5_9RICK|nr:glutathione S-transferase family protein [Anaplasma ovis]ASI47543.1 glutathione S-transferase [Anaplasma ovis str. Haibei]